MQCPKCGSGVPDGSTQCHICFAPIDPSTASTGAPVGLQAPSVQQQAPAELEPGIPGLRPQAAPPTPNSMNQGSGPTPNYMNQGMGAAPPVGMGGGQMRTTLAGDVIETPAASMPSPQSPPMGGPGYTPRPGGPPSGPLPPGGARGSYTMPARKEYVPAKSGGGAVAWVVAILIILAAGGGGFWFWINNRTNPKDQAILVYKAVTTADWNGLYPLITLNDADKAKYKDAASFTKDISDEINKTPMGQTAISILKNFTNPVAGEPVINGNEADVPITADFSYMGQSMKFKGTAHLVKEWGIWKLKGNVSSATEMSKMITDLIGKPEGMAGGMGGGRMPGM